MNRHLGFSYSIFGAVLFTYGSTGVIDAMPLNISGIFSDGPIDKPFLLLTGGILFMVLGFETIWLAWKNPYRSDTANKRDRRAQFLH